MQADIAIAVSAFWIGVISSISLPLGAITARFWTPEERSVAAMMAFGGGALLAALSVDLVATSLNQGHFYSMAAGALLGGSIFILLNEAINDYGGFLRKVSTRIYHLRRKDYQRYRKVLSRLDDLHIFNQIDNSDFRAIAACIEIRHYARNTHIYRKGDPSEGLFILASGSVRLKDPTDPEQTIHSVGQWSSFSQYPFLVGSPNDENAVTSEASEVWLLPRDKFQLLLASSPPLALAVETWLRSPRTLDYLVKRLSMAAEEANQWLEQAIDDLNKHANVPPVVEVEHNESRFLELADKLIRIDMFKGLPRGEVDEIADCLVHKQIQRGDLLFHAGDICDRLYIIDSGEVSFLSPQDLTRDRSVLSDGHALGVQSFVTGARHSRSAVASKDTQFWVLLRKDIAKLLHETPLLRSRFEHYLESDEIRHYLQINHAIDPDKNKRWISRVKRDIDQRKQLTPIHRLTNQVHGYRGAALAIWLGIFLDGIPESLVLGTIQAKASISLSLIAGLFISNYPEALSSSIGMRHQGFRFRRILLMWSSLVLVTGFGAALGAYFLGNVSPSLFSLIEGVAAGAMLTMIAQTMLPEAYFKGGNIVGMATLLGFLTALFFKELG